MGGIIDGIFAACCGIMCGMADMMGCTYEYVNVVLFCYVEPLLTVLMLFGAAYVLLGLPGVRCVGKGFMWFGITVSAVTGLLLIASGINALTLVDKHNITQADMDSIMAMITRPDPDPLVHDMFQKTMHWLMDSSKGNMGYNAFNLLIYVLLMPSAILSSIIICYKSFRKSNRPTD